MPAFLGHPNCITLTSINASRAIMGDLDRAKDAALVEFGATKTDLFDGVKPVPTPGQIASQSLVELLFASCIVAFTAFIASFSARHLVKWAIALFTTITTNEAKSLA